MNLTLIAAIASLALWIVLAFLFPLGPSGAAAHLLLGVSAVLFVRWYALQYER
jgi:hypothetical protein